MTKRKELGTLGRKRKADYVRWYREPISGGAIKIRVQWKPLGEPRPTVESFDDTRKGLQEAKAFAEGVHEALQLRRPEAPEPIALRALVEKHVEAKDTAWAPATLRNLRWRWGKLELHRGRSTPAHLVTREHLDALKRDLLKQHSPNQVRLIVKAIVSVFRWAVDRDLIPPTKIIAYTAGKFSKEIEAKAPVMAEYSAGEREKIRNYFDPTNVRQWRPWVANTLVSYCGPRIDAALSIWWDDIDFEKETILWRAANDKTGRDRVQPLPAPVIEALWVAYGWAIAAGYSGQLVFFRPGAGTLDRGSTWKRRAYSTARSRRRAAAKPDKPWTYQAYLGQLRRAEAASGINHILYRGAHAHRRGVAGDVAANRGIKAAADWIGDKSMRVVERSYVLTRAEELRKTADFLTPAAVAVAARKSPKRSRTKKGNRNEMQRTRHGQRVRNGKSL